MFHQVKRHKLGHFARYGGPFTRAHFVLEIFGDDLDPDELTGLLGAPPSEAYRKDDETPGGARYRRTGGWILDSGPIRLSEERTGDTDFENWLAALTPNRSVWDQLQSRFTLILRLAAYTDQTNAEFILTPKAMTELCARGLSLRLDPYVSLEDDV